MSARAGGFSALLWCSLSYRDLGRMLDVHQPRPSLGYDLRRLCNDPIAVPRGRMQHLEEDHQSPAAHDAATSSLVSLSFWGRGSVG